MKKTLSMVLCTMALAFAGCGGGDSAPKSGCEGVGANLKKMMKDEMAKEMKESEAEMKDAPPEMKKQMEKMKGMVGEMTDKTAAAAVSSCKEDKWPEEAIKCFNEAKTEDDFDKCKDSTPQDLQDKMKARMDKIEEEFKEKMGM